MTVQLNITSWIRSKSKSKTTRDERIMIIPVIYMLMYACVETQHANCHLGILVIEQSYQLEACESKRAEMERNGFPALCVAYKQVRTE
jgi:hypothetical protein